MPTLRVPVGGNGHRSIQRPIQTRSDGHCPDVRKKISQSVSHKSEPHPDDSPVMVLSSAVMVLCPWLSVRPDGLPRGGPSGATCAWLAPECDEIVTDWQWAGQQMAAIR